METTAQCNLIINKQTGAEIPLAMQRLDLAGRVYPFGGVVQATHSFKVAGDPATDQAVEALYVAVLPRGGALRRFIIKGENFEVKSELHPKAEARKQYEAGTAAGHLSALAEQEKDGLVTLSVGQIRPGETVQVILEVTAGVKLTDKGFTFRYPFTVAPSYHSKATAVSTPTGGRIHLPSNIFGDLILPEWKSVKDGLHEIGFSLVLDAGCALKSVGSPSHRVTVSQNKDGTSEVVLAAGGDLPNRDVVIEATVEDATSRVFLDFDSKSKLPSDAPTWVAVLPSSAFGKVGTDPRRVVFLIDHSGSMQGAKLDQAKLALRACLAALEPTDMFGLVRFENNSTKFHGSMTPADGPNRARADKWVEATQPAGGTELLRGLSAAVEVLGSGGGDIFLLTDGEVFDTGPIIEQLATSGVRVHTLGINTASQDRFLSSLARKTGGTDKFCNPSQNVATYALELFASMRKPIAEKLDVLTTPKGKAAIPQIKTVWEGSPVVIHGSGAVPTKLTFKPEGKGKTINVTVPKGQKIEGGLIPLLWAAQQIEDLESVYDMAIEGPVRASIGNKLKALSENYQISSRMMSLVAVVERVGDQAGQMKQHVVPVGTPEDMGAVLWAAGGAQCFSFAAPAAVAAPAGVYVRSAFPAARHAVRSLSFGGGFAGGRIGAGYTPPGVYTQVMTNSSSSITLGDSGTSNLLDSDGSTLECLMVEEITGIEGDTTLDWMGVDRERGVGEEYTSGGLRGRRAKPNATPNDLVALCAMIGPDGGVQGSTDPELRILLTTLLAFALHNEIQQGRTFYQMYLDRIVRFLEQQPKTSVLTTTLARLRQSQPVQTKNWINSYGFVQCGTLSITQAWQEVQEVLA